MGLALCLACLPFELYAGVGLAGLTFTNVEILTLAVLALWGLLLVRERRLPHSPRAFALPAALLLATLLASAASAPEWRGAALKFTARQAQGVLFGCCLADQVVVYGWPLARRLGLALIVGVAISAAFGLLEFSESPFALVMLAVFKDRPTLAGGLLRLSATFAYANIAAMYYEAALPILLVAVGLAAGRRAWLLAGATLLVYIATLLTYSRAALFTATAAVIVVLLAIALFQRRVNRLQTAIAAARGAPAIRRVVWLCAALLALVLSLLLVSPTFRVRIAEPDLANWYRADYGVAPLPQLAPNERIQTLVTVNNRGPITWRSDGLRPVMLSYHWLDPRTRLVVRYNGRRTLLPRPVAPGDGLALTANVQAPDKPGSYLLVWDLVVEHSNWFSERGNPVVEVAVTVAGTPVRSQPAPEAEPAGLPDRITVIPPPPARSELWGAALRLWRGQPILGIGPDVFRHVYGRALGLSSWDDRVHTNNLYLELLVGAGLAGLLVFLALVVLLLAGAMKILARRPEVREPTQVPSPLWWMTLGCGVGLLTYLIHGMLDMFLEYNSTALLLWALLGFLGGLIAINSRSIAASDPGA